MRISHHQFLYHRPQVQNQLLPCHLCNLCILSMSEVRICCWQQLVISSDRLLCASAYDLWVKIIWLFSKETQSFIILEAVTIYPIWFERLPPLWSATGSNIVAVGGRKGITYSCIIRSGGTPKGWLWIELTVMLMVCIIGITRVKLHQIGWKY